MLEPAGARLVAVACVVLIGTLHVDVVIELAGIFAERHDDLRTDRPDLHGLADMAIAAMAVFVVFDGIGARHRPTHRVGQQFELRFHSFFKAPCGTFEAFRFPPGGVFSVHACILRPLWRCWIRNGQKNAKREHSRGEIIQTAVG